MRILGISAFYHDSAAALLEEGRIVAAAQEERFTRKKHDEGFPARAIEYCLSEAGISASDLDYVGFYDKPLLKFERILETYLSIAPKGFRSFLKAGRKYLASCSPVEKPVGKVAYFVDTYANYNDHELGFAVLEVLRHNDIEVVLPKQLPAPLPAIVYGDVETARKDLAYSVKHLARAVRDLSLIHI